MQLGDVAEVLPVEADDQRGEEQDGGDRGQLLHHVVLLVRDLRLVVVADAGKQVAGELEVVRRPEQLVVGVAEVELDLMGEHLAVRELDPVVDHLANRVTRGGERAPDVEHVVAEGREPNPDPVGGPLLDVVLEIVDRVVDAVDQVEEALRDVVDEVVGDHRDVVLLRARRPGLARMPGRPAPPASSEP